MGTSAERIARLRGSPLDKWQLYGLILHDHELVPSCYGVAWQLLEHYNAKRVNATRLLICLPKKQALLAARSLWP